MTSLLEGMLKIYLMNFHDFSWAVMREKNDPGQLLTFLASIVMPAAAC